MSTHASDTPLSKDEADRLEELLRRCEPGPWVAVVEGRDQTSGASFIQTGPDHARGSDLYITRSLLAGGNEDADSDLLDLIALMRTSIPRLLREVREHEQATTDYEVWNVPANYWRRWRAIGGRVALHAETLRFEPRLLERALGGDAPYRALLSDIVAIEVTWKGFVPRRRLLVTTRDGLKARFLVGNVEAVANDLRRAVAAARQGGHR